MVDREKSESRIEFSPLVNGVDYLLSAVEHLEGGPSARNLKYAVLHLQAGVEVLLKSRLIINDWKLVFGRPGKATLETYRKGDFYSCSAEEALSRLSDIGVEIPKDAREEITYLSRQRNRLQHFGLTDTAAAVEARTANVLNFLLDFIRNHLQPVLLDTEADHLATQMNLVRSRLHRIQSLVTTRMQALAPQLSRAPWQTLHCPQCGQWALVVDTQESTCLFCHAQHDRQELPLDYVAIILEQGYRAFRKGEPYADCCPQCDDESLVHGVLVAADPDRPIRFCFSCAEAFDNIDDCTRCGLPFITVDDEGGLCGRCWDELTSRD